MFGLDLALDLGNLKLALQTHVHVKHLLQTLQLDTLLSSVLDELVQVRRNSLFHLLLLCT